MGTLTNAHSWAASISRGTAGLFAQSGTRQPEQPLELFEFESCPFCRKVREALSELDLEYIARSCGRGSAKRALLRARGGREMVPYLIDPNSGTEMYESEAIIDYLYQRYAAGERRWTRHLSPLNTLTASLTSALRNRGGRAKRAREEQPAERLELFNFEASPYCRKVREVLNELDLDCLIRNVAKGSARRPQLKAHGGRMMVPYLIDPNSDTAMYESDDIIAYLRRTYG